MQGYTTFDKALAAFIGSLIAILGFLGVNVPEFFISPSFIELITVIAGPALTFLLTYVAKNNDAPPAPPPGT